MAGCREKLRNITIGLDFGNTDTKIIIDRGSCEDGPVSVAVKGISRYVVQPWKGESCKIPIIPSLIYYTEDGSILIGCEVEDRHLDGSDATIGWMARQIILGSPVRIQAGGKLLTYPVAVSDFLGSIICRLGDQEQIRGADLVVAVPEDSTDQFWRCLSQLDTGGVTGKIQIIEKPAAVVSSSLPEAMVAGIANGKIIMIIDFGGSHLEVSMIYGHTDHGRIQWRTLGSATSSLGGRDLDCLISEKTGYKRGITTIQDDRLARIMHHNGQIAKEALSFHETTDLAFPGGGSVRISRKELEDILESEGIYARISSTIERALHTASSRGYSEHSLGAVILMGGSCAIPSIETLIKARFGAVKTISDRPIDAAARGAASYKSEHILIDRSPYEYAIRVWNPELRTFELRTVIRRGCRIPKEGPVSRFRIQATYDGQTRLGIVLYCLNRRSLTLPRGRDRELVYLQSGVMEVMERDQGDRSYHGDSTENEHGILFIPADPPAMRKEPRFEIGFSINRLGEVVVSATDLLTGKQVLKDVRPEFIRGMKIPAESMKTTYDGTFGNCKE